MPAKRLLTALEVDEVSAVDEPANDDSRVLLLKAANAVAGVSAIRKALRESGDEALAEAFDGAMQEAGPEIAAMVAAEADGALPTLAHGLATSMATIADEAPAEDRADLMAAAATEFVETVRSVAVEAGVEVQKGKGAPMGGKRKGKAGDGFSPCADCPNPAGCKAAGVCAAEKSSPVSKASDTLAAFGAMGERIQKAAASFAALNSGREQREALNRMNWVLQDSVSSIMGDAAVTDKAAMIRKSVAEFDAAVADLIAEIEEDAAGDLLEAEGTPVAKGAGGNNAGGAGHQENRDMPDTERDTIVKSLQAEVLVMKAREAKREAITKAKGMLPAGGPIDQLGDLLAGASEAQLPLIEGVVKALAAQVDASRVFASFGAAAPGNGDMAPVSPVVKAAQKRADEVAAQRRRGAAA